MTNNRVPRRLLLAFVLSGISALIYEVIWVRLLGDLFGHTIYAIQVVLAVFFGGVAAGSFFSDRINPTGKRALKIYAVIELLIGASALLFPLLTRLATPLYDQFAPFEMETGGALAFRLVIATLLLFIPTALMGATFPLIVRWHLMRDGEISGIASLYSVNTFGGAFGAWTSAFLLIPLVGIRNSLCVAAIGNLAAAYLALSFRIGSSEESQAVQNRSDETVFDDAQVPVLSRYVLALLLFSTGFVAIALEVLWARALDQVLSGTIYSFATVLTVFLLGIVSGSWLYRGWLWRFPLLYVFVVVATALANYVLASLLLIRFVPSVSELLTKILGLGFISRGVILESLLSAFILLIPASFMGIIFPLLLSLARHREQQRRLGLLVAANTAGCVVGPIASGFLLLPYLGLLKSLIIIAVITLALAMLVFAFMSDRRRLLPIIGAGAVVALVLFLFGPRDVRIWRGNPGEKLIDFYEDPAATISVVESSGPVKERRLKVNNTYSLGGGRGIFTERRQGHLPMLLHPSPDRVLVLGVGTGNTLGAISLHSPSRLLAVDLIPGVLKLARKHFGDTNYRVMDNPRVKVLSADALRIARATPEKYDVIIADLFHPWQAGVGSLYSKEHFSAVRKALADGGIFCQWLPLYQLSEDDLKTIVRTFLSVYPESSAWLGNFGTQTPILALIGSERPAQLQWQRWEMSLSNTDLNKALSDVYLDRPAEIVGSYICDKAELETFSGTGPLNGLDQPIIELNAPVRLFSNEFELSKLKSLEALLDLGARSVPISFAGARTPPPMEDLRDNKEAVRLMIKALLQRERGDKQAALRTAIQSTGTARGYDVPVAILTELAWNAYQEFPAAAEQGFQQALRVRPEDPNALTGLGYTYLALRRVDEAINLFQRALKVRNDWSEALEGLEQAKRLKEAS